MNKTQLKELWEDTRQTQIKICPEKKIWKYENMSWEETTLKLVLALGHIPGNQFGSSS